MDPKRSRVRFFEKYQVFAAAVTALVVSPEGADGERRILLLKPTYKQGWDFPGGMVEKDEDPRIAAEREALEELGLPITARRLLTVQYHMTDTGVPLLAFVFLMDLVTPQTQLHLSSEHSEYRWCTKREAELLLEDNAIPAVHQLRLLVSLTSMDSYGAVAYLCDTKLEVLDGAISSGVELIDHGVFTASVAPVITVKQAELLLRRPVKASIEGSLHVTGKELVRTAVEERQWVGLTETELVRRCLALKQTQATLTLFTETAYSNAVHELLDRELLVGEVLLGNLVLYPTDALLEFLAKGLPVEVMVQ